MNDRVSLTIAVLWAAVVGAITLWFVTNPDDTQAYIDTPGLGKHIVRTSHFDTNSWLLWCGIATALGVVALILAAVWTRPKAVR